MKTIQVNFDSSFNRAVKPVHGVCNGPLSEMGLIDTSKYYRKIGIPFIRLHDTDTPTSRTMVDISKIFPNFDADETDPANYYFQHTDQLLSAIDKVGAKTIYRLGESIDHSVFNRHARPPKDFEKWARICQHIIMHYNAGWADGFTLGVSYWEIWNEPDLGKEMWADGTAQQYFELYQTTAVMLKKYDPALKIGGCALAGHLDFAENFLKHCQTHQLPLDFFSFHLYYRDISRLREFITTIDSLLSKYGFSDAERILDEWNYFGLDGIDDLALWKAIRDVETGYIAKQLFETCQNEIGASYAVASMIAMNDLPVDIAAYYDGQPKLRYCGLFDRYAIPQKTYYGFCAYGELYRLNGGLVKTATEEKGIYALAAAKDDTAYILVSNYEGESGYYTVHMTGLHPDDAIRADLYLLDHETDLQLYRTEFFHGNAVKQTVRLDNHAVCLIKLTKTTR